MMKKFLSQFFLQLQTSHETGEWPVGDVITGFIEPYWEQGMEGCFEYTFVPDDDRQAINGGRGYFLRSGDYLRIIGRESETIWEGKIKFMTARIHHLISQDRHNLNNQVWATAKQEGVSYADWVGWFWSQPRLRAEFLKRKAL